MLFSPLINNELILLSAHSRLSASSAEQPPSCLTLQHYCFQCPNMKMSILPSLLIQGLFGKCMCWISEACNKKIIKGNKVIKLHLLSYSNHVFIYFILTYRSCHRGQLKILALDWIQTKQCCLSDSNPVPTTEEVRWKEKNNAVRFSLRTWQHLNGVLRGMEVGLQSRATCHPGDWSSHHPSFL